jgi:hypothetical protein
VFSVIRHEGESFDAPFFCSDGRERLLVKSFDDYEGIFNFRMSVGIYEKGRDDRDL